MRTKTIDPLYRIKDVDLFFQGAHPVQQSLQRLAKLLQLAGIPYAIMGGMAVNLHGAERTTKDVDILLTQQGLDQFRKELLGTAYDQDPQRKRRFVDRQNGIFVDILVTGHYPGRGGPAPFAFPDPQEASEEIGQVRVVTLLQLIQLKLAARRYYDFGDVVRLIRVHHLDESFLEKLHQGVRQDYIACLEENRREDEYERNS